MPGRENSKSQGVAIASASGRGGFGSRRRDRDVLAFYSRSHVQPSGEGMATNR